MGIDAAGYLAHLQALLPPGAAWTRERDANLAKLLRALAEELARVDGRAVDLLRECDPRTAFEMLSDWERVTGLPDQCTGALITIQERRQAVAMKLASTGGQSRQYFIDLAAALGVEITITEFLPFQAGRSVAGDALYNDDGWRHFWKVNSPETTNVNYFRAGMSAAGEPLRTWGDKSLECIINVRKPAHTTVFFAYYT